MKTFKIKYLLGGFFIALLLIRVFHVASTPVSVQLFALFLAYTACVYFGAALSDMRVEFISLELIFSLFIFLFSCLGLLYSPFWLVIGYIFHGIWDILHHFNGVKTKVIKWFPPVCAVVDFVVAGFIFIFY